MTNTQKPIRSESAVLRLTESAVMIALATVLSLLKLIDLPYGGSVTAASMLPLMIIAFRHGTAWGCFAGVAHGLVQILFSSSLSYVTGAVSVAAVVVLDFVVAFAAAGAAGFFRRVKKPATALLLGAITVGVLRYLCHVISGATVWAGISIPTAAALIYSIGYNATYMLPETVILAAAAYYIGSILDFRAPTLVSHGNQSPAKASRRILPSLTALVAAVVYDVLAIFPHTQDAETGAFSFAGLDAANWVAVAVVSGGALVIAAVLYLLLNKRTRE